MWDGIIEFLKWTFVVVFWLFVLERLYRAVGSRMPRRLRRPAQHATELSKDQVHCVAQKFHSALDRGQVRVSLLERDMRIPFANVEAIAREHGYRFHSDAMPVNSTAARWNFHLDLPSLREVRKAPEIEDLRTEICQRWPQDPLTREWQDHHKLAARRAQRAINYWNGLVMFPGILLVFFSPGFVLSELSTIAFVVLLVLGGAMLAVSIPLIVRLYRRKKWHINMGEAVYNELASALVRRWLRGQAGSTSDNQWFVESPRTE